MSSTVSETMVSALLSIINTAQGELGKMGNASGSVNKKGAKTKKSSARKGRPTPHGDFTKKIMEDHKAEVEAFKAELKESNPDQKGAHLIFVSNYKKAHMDEYNAFEAAWKEAHPKEDSASESSSVAEASDAEANTTEAPKSKRPPMTEEHKAKLKAGREKKQAEKKAAKEAEEQAANTEAPATTIVPEVVITAPAVVAPVAKKQGKKVKNEIVTPIVEPIAVAVVAAPVVAAPVPVAADAEDSDPELLAFKHAGTNYLRLGIKRAEGNHLWASGDLWASKKGQKGAYIGCLQEDGKIDKDAEEPELE